MNSYETHLHDPQSLAEDARSLVAATTAATEETLSAGRRGLAAAWNKGMDTWHRARGRAVQGAKAADEVISGHPYRAIAIALGVGAVFACLFTRRTHD